MKLWDLKIESIFLFVAGIFGLLFTFTVPPLQVADEYEHFNRSYQISTFNFISEKKDSKTGGFVPESFCAVPKAFSGIPFFCKKKVNFNNYKSLFSIPLNEEKQVFIEFPGGSSYFPAAYLPQSLGIGIGRLFALSPVILMYMGRVCSLFFWMFVIYWSIRLIPHKKGILLLLALSPMSLSEAASLSADGVTNALAFLMLAYVSKLAFDDSTPITTKNIFLLCVIGCLLSVIKVVYFLMIFLIFIIPANKFQGWKDYTVKTLCIFFSSLLFTLFWFYLVRDIASPQSCPGVDMNLQLKSIISAPWGYLKVLYTTFCMYWKWYIWSFIGILGWLDTYMPRAAYWIFTALLLILLSIDNSKRIRLRSWQILILFTILIISVLAIFTSVYLTASSVGLPYVHGVQGRYFIPLAPLLFAGINFRRFEADEKFVKQFCLASSVFINLVALYSVIDRYYGF